MEKETGRIEAFSDAVFAIAITLLVLELHIPVIEKNEGKESLVSELASDWPSYLAFSLSFFSIFIMWVNHHKIFKQIYKRNTALMFANGLILFLATCISYPTALLSRYYNTSSDTVVVAIYTALFVLINLSFNLFWWIASRDKSLLRPGITDEAITSIKKNYLFGIPIHVLAFVVSFFWPGISLMICAGLWSFWAFTSGKIDLTLKQNK
jgi:uncharacterized membrane protein